MKYLSTFLAVCFVGWCLPLAASAQATTSIGGVTALQKVLDNVYNQLVPMSGKLITVSRGLAAFGTLFYIGYRVWKHLARAEPIDFFPLLRPAVLLALIGAYPYALDVLNGVLSPLVTGTAQMQTQATAAVQALLIQEATTIATNATTGDIVVPSPGTTSPDYNKYAQPDGSGDSSGGIGGALHFAASIFISSARTVFKLFLSLVLELLYYAAALCIDVIRAFHLMILAILGPLVLGFACFDGLQHTLTQWISRYINVFLWLPVANLIGAILATIQANMLNLDLARAQAGSVQLFNSTDLAYMIFLLMGVVGYFQVPSIANYIIQPYGGNPIAQKVTSLVSSAASVAITAATGVPVNAGGSSGGSSGGAEGGVNPYSGKGVDDFQRSQITG